MLRCHAFLLSLVIAAPAGAGEIWQRHWIEVDSPNFVLVSDLSKSKTVKLARKLEDFRIVVSVLMHDQPPRLKVPTIAYVVPDSFEVGETRFTLRASRIVVPNNFTIFQLRHEYARLRLRPDGRVNLPTWYEEGMAHMFRDMSIRRDNLRYREPMTSWILSSVGYGWEPYGHVLDARSWPNPSDAKRLRFILESWVLVNYLVGHIGAAETSDAFQRYLQFMEEGFTPIGAFEPSFGIPVDSLRGILVDYYKQKLRYHRIQLSEPLPKVDVKVRAMPSDEAAARLGELLLSFDELAAARRYFDAALGMNPNNTIALAGFGKWLQQSDRAVEAPAYFERALANDPHNAWHELDYAEFFLARAHALEKPAEVQAALVEAHRHFARSYAIDPRNPETLAMNGDSYLFAGQSLDKALVSLRAAHAMLPAQPTIDLLLGRAYLASGQNRAALETLRPAAAWGDPDTAAAAKALLMPLEQH